MGFRVRVRVRPRHHAHHARDGAHLGQLARREHGCEELAEEVHVRVLVLRRDERLPVEVGLYAWLGLGLGLGLGVGVGVGLGLRLRLRLG